MNAWILEYFCDHEEHELVEAVRRKCNLPEPLPFVLEAKLRIAKIRRQMSQRTKEDWFATAADLEVQLPSSRPVPPSVLPLSVLSRIQGVLKTISEVVAAHSSGASDAAAPSTACTRALESHVPEVVGCPRELRQELVQAAREADERGESPMAEALGKRFTEEEAVRRVAETLRDSLKVLGESTLDRIDRDISQGLYNPNVDRFGIAVGQQQQRQGEEAAQAAGRGAGAGQRANGPRNTALVGLTELLDTYADKSPDSWNDILTCAQSAVKRFRERRAVVAAAARAAVEAAGTGDASMQQEDSSQVSLGPLPPEVLARIKETEQEPSIRKRKKGSKRRPVKPFTAEEEENLRKGVDALGVGSWSAIRMTFNFKDRTPVDLKDKWRNMQKRASRQNFEAIEQMADTGRLPPLPVVAAPAPPPGRQDPSQSSAAPSVVSSVPPSAAPAAASSTVPSAAPVLAGSPVSHESGGNQGEEDDQDDDGRSAPKKPKLSPSKRPPPKATQRDRRRGGGGSGGNRDDDGQLQTQMS